jgi:hypothetical protein
MAVIKAFVAMDERGRWGTIFHERGDCRTLKNAKRVEAVEPVVDPAGLWCMACSAERRTRALNDRRVVMLPPRFHRGAIVRDVTS